MTEITATLETRIEAEPGVDPGDGAPLVVHIKDRATGTHILLDCGPDPELARMLAKELVQAGLRLMDFAVSQAPVQTAAGR